MNFIKRTTLTVAAFAGLMLASQAQAQQVAIGAHVGALGTNDATKIGYGANLTFVPSDILGFFVDASFANFSGTSYFSTAPALMYIFPGSEELKFAALAGMGFHKFEGVDMRFGANVGVAADFFLAPNFSVGFLGRYHLVFGDGGADVYNAFLTAKFAFSTGDGW